MRSSFDTLTWWGQVSCSSNVTHKQRRAVVVCFSCFFLLKKKLFPSCPGPTVDVGRFVHKKKWVVGWRYRNARKEKKKMMMGERKRERKIQGEVERSRHRFGHEFTSRTHTRTQTQRVCEWVFLLLCVDRRWWGAHHRSSKREQERRDSMASSVFDTQSLFTLI